MRSTLKFLSDPLDCFGRLVLSESISARAQSHYLALKGLSRAGAVACMYTRVNFSFPLALVRSVANQFDEAINPRMRGIGSVPPVGSAVPGIDSREFRTRCRSRAAHSSHLLALRELRSLTTSERRVTNC